MCGIAGYLGPPIGDRAAASRPPEEYADGFAHDRQGGLGKGFGATFDGYSADRYLETLRSLVIEKTT